MAFDKKLFEFAAGDTVVVSIVQASDARRHLYESFGILPGMRLTIFLVTGKKVILFVGQTKLALSGAAASEIYGVNLYEQKH